MHDIIYYNQNLTDIQINCAPIQFKKNREKKFCLKADESQIIKQFIKMTISLNWWILGWDKYDDDDEQS